MVRLDANLYSRRSNFDGKGGALASKTLSNHLYDYFAALKPIFFRLESEWNRIESRVDWEKEYSNMFEFIGKLGSRVELFSTRDFVKACW